MLTVDDLDNLRELAKRQTANHAEKKILAAVEEIEQLRENVEEAARLNLAVMKESEHFFREAERLRALLRLCHPLIMGDPVYCYPSSQLVQLSKDIEEAIGNEPVL